LFALDYFFVLKSSSNFWATSFHGKSYAIILTRHFLLGYILGDFSQTRPATLVPSLPNVTNIGLRIFVITNI
jgi:hypothetical protein